MQEHVQVGVVRVDVKCGESEEESDVVKLEKEMGSIQSILTASITGRCPQLPC